jgi:hypothetical protein
MLPKPALQGANDSRSLPLPDSSTLSSLRSAPWALSFQLFNLSTFQPFNHFPSHVWLILTTIIAGLQGFCIFTHFL